MLVIIGLSLSYLLGHIIGYIRGYKHGIADFGQKILEFDYLEKLDK